MPCHLCLVVDEVRLVFAFGVHGSQQITRGLIANTMHMTLCAVAPTHIAASTQQAHAQARFQLGRAFVLNVEYGRHLVAVFRIESSCREIDALHHVGVDEAESLLLSAADEQWSVHLDAVDIDGVLVEATAAHVVLAAGLVVLADAGKSDQ